MAPCVLPGFVRKVWPSIYTDEYNEGENTGAIAGTQITGDRAWSSHSRNFLRPVDNNLPFIRRLAELDRRIALNERATNPVDPCLNFEQKGRGQAASATAALFNRVTPGDWGQRGSRYCVAAGK
jgi:hypothetical protein